MRWTWEDNTFDYIHLRGLMGSIVDWHALYRNAFRCCKPGGYVEHFENSINMECDDGSIAPGSPMHQWGKVFWAGGEKFGRTFRVVEDDIQKKCMEEAGFVDITVWEHKVRHTIRCGCHITDNRACLPVVPYRQLAS